RVDARRLAVAMALAEHLTLYPLCYFVDRHHPARGESGVPPLLRSTRAFAQATWRHAVFGAILGRLPGLPAARVATNAPTSRICCWLSVPEKDGIPPPPLSTFACTCAKPGRSWSRFGPICPPAPAALSVWHELQLLSKTVLPAAAFAPAGTTEAFGAGAA